MIPQYRRNVTRFGAVALVAALAGFAAGCQKSDRQLARGEWTVASIETADGHVPSEAELRAVKVTVKGNRLTVRLAGASVSGLFTLDPTKEPKELDAPEVYVIEGREERQLPGTIRGIYKFEGKDELVLALAVGEGKDLPRPTEFKPSTLAGKRQEVIVLHLKRREAKP